MQKNLNNKVSSAISTVTAKVAGAQEKIIVTERFKRCEEFDEVTDISKEYSTGTRKTKANIARALGLEPPAQSILDGNFVDFKSLLSNGLKTVKDVEEHLKICLADLINRDEEVRKVSANIDILKKECRVSAKLSREAEKNRKDLEKRGIIEKYKNFIGEKWNAEDIRDHTVSALNKGFDEGIITWKIECEFNDAKYIHPFSRKSVYFGMKNFYQEALAYSIKNYFIPRIERKMANHLKDKAKDRSIVLFGENVDQLLSQEGIRDKFVIALDPGRSKIKTAFLKPTGEVVDMSSFSIYGTRFDGGGVDLLKKWSQQTERKDIVFAIGNGTNTYNTQIAVSDMINSNVFPKEINVSYCIVPEHGASKYSCTPSAIEEFGENAEITEISAVSIGRRLIDPMSEYVKIEPQHLGKGQYQLSVDPKKLNESLLNVVRDRVSFNGVDLNTASKNLLQRINGLNEKTAKEIVQYREQNGRFRSRAELKEVKGIGALTFQQCAGFLTVSRPDDAEDGPPKKKFKKSSTSKEWNPFDETIVHPDDYRTGESLLGKLNVSIEDITGRIKSFSISRLTAEEAKVLNLLQNLTLKTKMKPPPPLRTKVGQIRDLAEGQRFTGTVSNKTDFGVFIDIGVGQDGLAHISHFKDGHYSLMLPSVNDSVEVVIDKIREDGKISLSPVY